MKHKWLVLLAITGLLLTSSTGLTFQDDDTNVSATASTVVLPWTVRIATPEPTSIDPALASDFTITNQLFSGLTRIDPDTDEPVPDLASSWVASTGATQFTFTLRSGLTWSNGSPLTAADVKYGILRSLQPATASNAAYVLFAIQNAEEYNNGTITNPDLVGVTVLSSTEIRFDLVGPASYFPAVLAHPVARPVPAATIATWGTTWTEANHIVTSGPYRLTEWVHNDHMLLDKYASFYDESNVQIKHVYVNLVEEMPAWNLFLSGDLDTVTVPQSVLSSVRTDPNLSQLLHDANNLCTYYYGFSIDEPPFDELEVRKAFIAAVNRQGLIDTVTQGSQKPAQTLTSPGIFGHVDGPSEGVGIPYNPTQAQTWLSDAGFPNGDGLPPITLTFNSLPGHQSIAEYIQQNWEDNLNVTVTLESMAWNDYISEVGDGNFQIWRMGWCSDYNDAYNFLSDGIFPGRHGGWSNASYQGLLDSAAQSTVNATRKDYYQQAEEILVETDAVMIPIYYYGTPVVTRPYLERPYNSQDLHIRDWILTAPQVDSITLASTDPTSANSVDFTVTFSEPVTGVDATDFTFTKTGSVNSYSVTGVAPPSGSADTFTVTVNPGFGVGTLRLDVKDSGTSIEDLDGNPMYSGFIDGEAYTVDKGIKLRSQGKYDGWILERTETSNKGGTMNSRSKVFYVGDDAYNRQYRAILSFNTADIPDTAVITKVILKVKKAGLVGTNPFKTHKGLRADIRKGKFGTSPKLQLSDFQAKASKNLVGRFSSKPVSKWYTANLGSASYTRINKTGLTQFRLRFYKDDNNDYGADYFKFYSGNAGSSARPQLIVEYYIP